MTAKCGLCTYKYFGEFQDEITMYFCADAGCHIHGIKSSEYMKSCMYVPMKGQATSDILSKIR